MIDLSRDLEKLTNDEVYKLGRAMQYSQSTGNPSMLVGGLLSAAMAEARRRVGDEDAAEHRVIFTNGWEDIEKQASKHALKKLIAKPVRMESFVPLFKKILNHLNAEQASEWN